ncbi:cardiolipin-specific deacylase 1, mitochondrial [[Candida] anglica]|uniref:Cardiolipin-specific deacylase 1, mitochondrial n=1 Tax=[Candida] anglica TaxID=148631 RepID=A0ABP0EER4_9ASCO
MIARRWISSSFPRLESVQSSQTQSYLNTILSKISKKDTTKIDVASKGSVPSSKDSSTPTAPVYKRSTHPTSVPLNKLFSSNFPYSVTDSVNDYSYRENPLAFQHDLLSLLPFYPEPDMATGRSSKVFKVMLEDGVEDGNFINEFCIYPEGKSEADPPSSMNHLIMVHGYGGGLGFFLKNFDEISLKSDNWCIHAIDLLGYGCSSRPPFELEEETLDHVEDWFHNSYQTWLRKRGLDQVPREQILVMAHSMGAYLMTTYGIRKDPKFCEKLLMISPGAVIKHRVEVNVPTYFAKLWERNISPFVLVRKAGPLGSKVVSLWSSRRFAKLPEEEALRLHKYAYGIFQSPGSGEYMLNYLLAPGADARHPLVDRGMDKLRCNFLWCYGKEDWMDIQGGQECSEIIRKSGYNSEVMEIEDSGHHVYLDNISAFNELMIKEMGKFDKVEQK